MMKLLLFLILISNQVYANPQVVQLKQDDKAPFSGNLFNQEASEDAAKAKQLVPLYQFQVESLQSSLNLQTSNVNQLQNEKKILLDQNQSLAETIAKQKSLSDLEKIIYIGAGIVFTVICVDVASKVTK